MTDSEYTEITERLGKVEKQNRIMRLGGGVIILVVAVSLIGGAAKDKPEIAKVIKAEKFVVVDSEGKERVVIENSKDDIFGLWIYD